MNSVSSSRRIGTTHLTNGLCYRYSAELEGRDFFRRRLPRARLRRLTKHLVNHIPRAVHGGRKNCWRCAVLGVNRCCPLHLILVFFARARGGLPRSHVNGLLPADHPAAVYYSSRRRALSTLCPVPFPASTCMSSLLMSMAPRLLCMWSGPSSRPRHFFLSARPELLSERGGRRLTREFLGLCMAPARVAFR